LEKDEKNKGKGGSHQRRIKPNHLLSTGPNLNFSGESTKHRGKDLGEIQGRRRFRRGGGGGGGGGGLTTTWSHLFERKEGKEVHWGEEKLEGYDLSRVVPSGNSHGDIWEGSAQRGHWCRGFEEISPPLP